MSHREILLQITLLNARAEMATSFAEYDDIMNRIEDLQDELTTYLEA